MNTTPNFERLCANRRHLHRFPELSFNEIETSTFIRSILTEHDIAWRACADTGTVATIGRGDRCVALRADIDALPIEEETDLPFRSQRPGIMHACGHDMHTSMALEAAILLKRNEDSLGGTVMVLFQPGEEKTPGGASIMIADGAFSDVQPMYIFGQHVDPSATVGTVSYIEGPMMAAADELYISIFGRGAHAAQPHMGSDPIVAAAGLIQHLQTLITRRRDPIEAGVLSITSIHGGTATNIIPERVDLKGTLRSFHQEWREFAWAWIERQSQSFCELHGCTASVTIQKGYPPLVNDPNAVECAQSVGARVAPKVEAFVPKMWAEDFSYYSSVAPSCFWMLGVRPPDTETMPGLHHPKFAPDESALTIGTTLLVQTALHALSC